MDFIRGTKEKIYILLGPRSVILMRILNGSMGALLEKAIALKIKHFLELQEYL